MLESISVKNLALIKESEVFLRKGLNILTGETGAGKSIILGSIRLALGERASKDIIRRGEDYALIELVFSEDNEKIIEKLKELDIPIEADGSIYIQRKILENRSICKCNGETISSRALKELASMLINIHGQNDTHALLDVRNYRDILDDFGEDDLIELKEACLKSYSEYHKLLLKLNESNKMDKGRDKELALAKFEIDEIEAARLIEGEDELLEEQYRIMKNGSRIAEALSRAYMALNPENGLGEGLGIAIRELNNIVSFDEGLNQIALSLSQTEDLLKDSLGQMQDYIEGLNYSEQEFRSIESRLDTYNHLKNKYGATVEKIFEYAKERQLFVNQMENFDSYIEDLSQRVIEAKNKAIKAANLLSKKRRTVATLLEEKLIENLKELNFSDVSFSIKIDSSEENLGVNGMDDIDFLVSFNKGEPVKSLSLVASGGELSRFMLALKAVTANKEEIGTLVFDEIDAGISGKTAWNVSKKMAYLSKNHQVIAITHLPQIAAMADSHYLIEKKIENDSTITDIYRLKDEAIENEIARLLSGGELTEAGILNARELILNAKSEK